MLRQLFQAKVNTEQTSPFELQVAGHYFAINEVFKNEFGEVCVKIAAHLEGVIEDVYILPGIFEGKLVISAYNQKNSREVYFYGNDLLRIEGKAAIEEFAKKWEVNLDVGEGAEQFKLILAD